MAPHIIAITLLLCGCKCILAQFPEVDVAVLSPKVLSLDPGRPGRFHRLPNPRSGSPQPLGNQRLRRPVTFKPRLTTTEDSLNVPNYPEIRGPRPIPIQNSQNSDQLFSPAQIQSPPTQQVKPVNEEREDDEENISQAIANLSAVSGFPQPTGRSSSAPEQYPTPASQQYGPPQGQKVPKLRKPIEIPTGRQPVPIKQFRPQQQQAQQSQQQPQHQPQPQQQHQRAPSPPQSNTYETRGKKPVAQSIKRYREDNADGSITWGFENDDGSYKEELIGVDCITRGKYGYVDPDGVRREYSYETGIRCDETQQDEDEQNGFVDYQENKLVLPSGKTIDLSTMGKNTQGKRRPQSAYRN
ncbi:mastermind-like protein 2 [Orussus abietinus]|uniref:mastermind-like protein 2 n=1 Tax=Orussus abietinus TaxID=222816 RepID=UPI000625D681|nr:mastermind-like protein 2 [Orussus abietinus]